MRPGRPVLAVALAAASLAGCAKTGPHRGPPLGRALGGAPGHGGAGAAPVGDPPAERGGTIAGPQPQPATSPAAIESSPRAALQRYALLYVNWRASGLVARERALAQLATGAARLTAEQDAAAISGAAALAADRVENRGVVLAISPGEGTAKGSWVILTEERTFGEGPYAGLPASLHVTLARVRRAASGWRVCEWVPRS